MRGAPRWCRLDLDGSGYARGKATDTANDQGYHATIRLASERDAEQIAAMYAPNVTQSIVSFETEVPTAEEMRGRIAGAKDRFAWLVCERQGQVLGYAYAGEHRSRSAYRWSVDVSAYVHEAARRFGVGKALYTSLISVLVLQGFYNAYAGIALPNPASVGLHEAIGFRPIGVYRRVGYKLGEWHDVGWWSLTLREHVADPAEPAGVSSALTPGRGDVALASGLEFLRDRAH